MAFNEKPLTLNDWLDSVDARQFIQDHTYCRNKIIHNEHRWAPDRSGKTKILFLKLMKINVIVGLEMVS